MTCKECLYYEVCKDYLVKCAEHGEAERINNPCTKFKNKADFVEVVRCSECKYKDECLQKVDCDCLGRELVYCSYGERKNDFKE